MDSSKKLTVLWTTTTTRSEIKRAHKRTASHSEQKRDLHFSVTLGKNIQFSEKSSKAAKQYCSIKKIYALVSYIVAEVSQNRSKKSGN